MSTFGLSQSNQSLSVPDDGRDMSCTATSVYILNLDSNKKPTIERKTGFVGILPGEPTLPPCRICAEKASGLHYGVNTCQACKVFFRRSLHKGTNYVCAANGTCDIVPGKRNSCAACRLKKCLNSGMSMSAIKTGRYTHTMKTKNIIEARGLNAADAISTGTVTCKDNHAARKSSVYIETSIPNNDPAVAQNKSPLVDGVRRPISPVPDSQEMEQIVQHITSVQSQQSTFTPEFIAEKIKNEKIYLMQRALHRQIFGPMKAIGVDEYMSLYQMTGIDIDGRRDMLQASFLPFAESVVKHCIVFAKSIPGFSQLPIKDQISLIKVTYFEFGMILGQQAFNLAEKLFVNREGKVFSIDEINVLSPGNGFFEEVFKTQGRLQNLNLTEEENCTLAALCIMSTDNCDLTDAELVARSRSLLLNCFLHLAETHHGEDPLFVARVVSVLVDLRSLREMHKQFDEHLALQWSRIVELPPIINEMLSTQ